MLTELYLKNYLMLQETRLSFDKGLNVITGETGAGKSILVGSISLIFGDNLPGIEAFDKDQPIYLEATFNTQDSVELNDFLSKNAIETETELIVAREINQSGKSSYFINGRKTGAAFIRELKRYLIDFHHQRDQQLLLSSSYQLDLLDAYAGLLPFRESYASQFREVKSTLKTLQELKAKAKNQKELSDLYRFQYEELENAKLHIKEDVELQNEYELLSRSLEITELCDEITTDLLEKDNSVFDLVNGHLSKLKRYQHLSSEIKVCVENLEQALEDLQETANLLSNYRDNLDYDAQRLENIQARLDLLNSLIHKHKVRSIEELLILFEERSAQIAAQDKSEKEIAALEKQLENTYSLLKIKGAELSLKRQKAALQLSQQLQTSIRALSIPEGILEIRIDKKAEDNFLMSDYFFAVTECGEDTVEFLFSANPGFEKKSLSSVVSGGELSRILLAIKQVLAERLEPKLIILDEIESGIGGKTAENVADFIALLSQRQQILCITHLAQIAARADKHLAIEKFTHAEKTLVALHELNSEERLKEIARMLSGSLSAKALAHAAELLDKITKRG